jgi:hypothetical protein
MQQDRNELTSGTSSAKWVSTQRRSRKGPDVAQPLSRLEVASFARRTGGGIRPARWPREGVITGYLLKLIRESAGLTQRLFPNGSE